jgi:phage tail sheath gpL-like
MEVSALMRAPWEVAAAAAAVSAQQTQIDPARACTGLTVAGFSAAKRGTGFTRAERDILCPTAWRRSPHRKTGACSSNGS